MQPPRDTQRLPAFDQPGVQNARTEQFAAARPGRPAAGQGSPAGDETARDETARRTGRGIAIGAALLVVLLVAGAVGLELGLRGSIKNNIRDEITASVGSTPEVELGAQPVLLSYVTGGLGMVRITTDGVPADGATGPVPAIDVTAEGVRRDGEVSRVDSLTGTAFVSDETMTAAAQAEGAGGGGAAGGADSLLGGLIQVQDIVSDPDTGTLRVSISGLAEAVVTPRLINGNLEMAPEQASIFGFQLPSSVLGGTISMMDSALADLPEGIQLTGVRVVPGGMVVDLSGRDVVLESPA